MLHFEFLEGLFGQDLPHAGEITLKFASHTVDICSCLAQECLASDVNDPNFKGDLLCVPLMSKTA